MIRCSVCGTSKQGCYCCRRCQGTFCAACAVLHSTRDDEEEEGVEADQAAVGRRMWEEGSGVIGRKLGGGRRHAATDTSDEETRVWPQDAHKELDAWFGGGPPTGGGL